MLSKLHNGAQSKHRARPTTPDILPDCPIGLPWRPVLLSPAAADDLVTDCANSGPQPFNKFASLAPKRSVIHPALLLGGAARHLRVSLHEGQHGIKRLLIIRQCHKVRSIKASFAKVSFIG